MAAEVAVGAAAVAEVVTAGSTIPTKGKGHCRHMRELSNPIITYYHALNFFGRSTNILASLPYGVGNLQGMVAGAEGHLCIAQVCWIRFTVFP
jgi:hypothetical protein